MREIKFRAWDSDFGTMVYEFTKDGYIVDMQNGQLKVGSVDGNNDYFQLEVMQFTGLLDKNGKEIYEGDIIAWDFEYDFDYDGDMPIVKRSVGKAEIKDIFDAHRVNWAAQESKGCEVIGNIYENPELLEPDLSKEIKKVIK